MIKLLKLEYWKVVFRITVGKKCQTLFFFSVITILHLMGVLLMQFRVKGYLRPFCCESNNEFLWVFFCLTEWNNVKTIKIWNWVTSSTQILQAQPFWKRHCYGYYVCIELIKPFMEKCDSFGDVEKRQEH